MLSAFLVFLLLFVSPAQLFTFVSDSLWYQGIGGKSLLVLEIIAGCDSQICGSHFGIMRGPLMIFLMAPLCPWSSGQGPTLATQGH
jgi:hypothetical protein